MATTNLFATAKVLKNAAKGKKPASENTLIEGLEVYAAIDHAIKWLKGLLETSGETPRAVAFEKFVNDGIKSGKKPESFNAKEGAGTANIQLRQKSSTSGLTEIEETICRENGVPLGTAGGEFFFNPEHNDWLLKNGDKISKALASIKDCPPNLLVKKEEKVIATEDSIPFIFSRFGNKPDLIATLLPMVSTLAIKPKFAVGSDDANDKSLEVITAFLGSDAEAA